MPTFHVNAERGENICVVTQRRGVTFYNIRLSVLCTNACRCFFFCGLLAFFSCFLSLQVFVLVCLLVAVCVCVSVRLISPPYPVAPHAWLRGNGWRTRAWGETCSVMITRAGDLSSTHVAAKGLPTAGVRDGGGTSKRERWCSSVAGWYMSFRIGLITITS